jgi:ribosomal protein S18 acetylase RimI-like enzyme
MTCALGNTARIVNLDATTDYRTFQEIEALHRTELAAGALAHMPPGFLASFYRYLATRPDCVVVVAENEGHVTGFVAGTLQASILLKSFVFAKPLEMAGHGAKLLLDPRLLFRVVSLALNLVAGDKQSHLDDRQLLSIAVDPNSGRMGIGTELFKALCNWFRLRGARDFEIIAATTQAAALQFYQRRGAVVVGETTLGGLGSIRFRYVLRPVG